MSETQSRNFIEEIIENDLESGRENHVHTRFPPEPNGYLHIGHSKAIWINYGIAKKYKGEFNLRFDDTNPMKEDDEYIRSIQKDMEWMGCKPDRVLYASDYFDYMFECALLLIDKGLAYVCELDAEQMRQYRGTLTQPGKESPYRNRSVEENKKLFVEMKEGKYADGEMTLRAKIDMASPNLNMRDPIIYRIMHETHYRAADKWCVYPMYDYAHPLEDAVEKITHSLCSLEFEDHRPLYDWVIDNCECEPKPHQYEFARMNLTRTIMSKRYLKRLVDEGVVSGWDDPRMPTLSGLRRRGYTPESIKDFCDRIGVAKSNSEIDVRLLEHCVREHLNAEAERRMAVLDPLKVTISNYEGSEMLQSENMPFGDNVTKRQVPFSSEIYIEKSDFMEDPPGKFFRLSPKREVRLKNAYIIKYEDCVKDENGEVIEVICSLDPDSKTGGPTAGRKVKGTLHWVDAKTALPCIVREYDYLLNEGEGDFMDRMNENSMSVMNSYIEQHAKDAQPGEKFQFMRNGYFVVDEDSKNGELVFNKIVSLKDSFSRTL